MTEQYNLGGIANTEEFASFYNKAVAELGQFVKLSPLLPNTQLTYHMPAGHSVRMLKQCHGYMRLSPAPVK